MNDVAAATTFTGTLLSYIGLGLLIVALLMRDIQHIRSVVIAAALAGLLFALFFGGGVVPALLCLALIIVAGVQLGRDQLQNNRAQFSAEEDKFVKERLYALEPREAREVLNMGVWADGREGTELTRQGKAVQHLIYLVSGEVDIRFDGGTVGVCLPGNYVGEMSVVKGGPATATAIVSEPSRYWMISAVQLRKLHTEAPRVAAALELGIAQDLRHKIIASNESHLTAAPGT